MFRRDGVIRMFHIRSHILSCVLRDSNGHLDLLKFALAMLGAIIRVACSGRLSVKEPATLYTKEV